MECLCASWELERLQVWHLKCLCLVSNCDCQSLVLSSHALPGVCPRMYRGRIEVKRQSVTHSMLPVSLLSFFLFLFVQENQDAVQEPASARLNTNAKCLLPNQFWHVSGEIRFGLDSDRRITLQCFCVYPQWRVCLHFRELLSFLLRKQMIFQSISLKWSCSILIQMKEELHTKMEDAILEERQTPQFPTSLVKKMSKDALLMRVTVAEHNPSEGGTIL